MHDKQLISSDVDDAKAGIGTDDVAVIPPESTDRPPVMSPEKVAAAYENAGTIVMPRRDPDMLQERFWRPGDTETKPKPAPKRKARWTPPRDNGPPESLHKMGRRQVDPWEEKRGRAPKTPPPLEQIATMRISRYAYDAIRNTIGQYPAERGGMLLSSTGDYTITDYVFDAGAATTGVAYNPNTAFLNRELYGRDDHFVGIVHSHPPSFRRLSGQDQRAAWSNLTSPGNPHLRAYLMPLVMTVPDTGCFELIPFIVVCHSGGDGEVVVSAVDLTVLD
ncbi:Mov34/MPN/PAD-1 family protein [Rhodospirillum sp. A1_3_36]|uniref:Mov34/MPN/PAD-1 family protein n=1 Tax=Rhodospirillum sp. A1_3_36 TaxID=3391666 RepID=UPI0039A66C62